MARFNTPVASDDEFDLVCDGESSSDIEKEDQYEHGRKISASTTAQYPSKNAEQLSGPHEVPTLPHPRSGQNLDADDGANPPRGAKGTGRGNNLVNDGLQHAKSVYNKFWAKDALIAVMG